MVDLGVNLSNQIVGKSCPPHNKFLTKRQSVKQFKKLVLADCMQSEQSNPNPPSTANSQMPDAFNNFFTSKTPKRDKDENHNRVYH